MQNCFQTRCKSSVSYLLVTGFCIVMGFNKASSQLSIENSITVQKTNAGEIQSTVIPPSTLYPRGCVLISDDFLHPPAIGTVIRFDLRNPTLALRSNFDNVPNSWDYKFGTSDHDLVTMPNGDVLFITGAFSKRPLSPKPAWFDSTFRDNFGPGARTVVLTWRSTDGGANFQFLSEFDPATVGDGFAAYPQLRSDNSTTRWDMGGSDGQYAKLLSGTDKVYMTFGVVGYNPKESTGKFILDPGKKIEKTLLLSSTGATSWTLEGIMEGHMWRADMVPVKEKQGSHMAFSGFFKNGGIIVGKNQAPPSNLMRLSIQVKIFNGYYGLQGH